MTSKPTWQCSLDSVDADLSTRGLEEQVKREMLAKSERGEKVKLIGAMMERGTPMDSEHEREWERERDRKDAMQWRTERQRESQRAWGLFHNLFTQPPSNMSHDKNGSTGTPTVPITERLTEAQRRELFQPFIAVDRMGRFYIPSNFTIEAPKMTCIPYRGSSAPGGPSAPEGSSAPDGPSDSGDVVAVSRAATATASDEDREADTRRDWAL
jgi:hypothetical protein